jgi:3-oxoacyl-[acyl-carrier-protein] synthase II
MKDKVVVTGINIISSLGLDMDQNWEKLIQGQSGISKISLFDASGFDTQIAGEVPVEFEEYSSRYIKKRLSKQMTRISRMCLAGVKALIEKEEVPTESFDKERCAVILGVLHTANSGVEQGTTVQNTILKGMNNALSAWISLEYGFEGPNYTIATACASSAYAIAQGYDLIARNQADFVIVGGADSTINPEELAGFNALYALSVNNDAPEKACCPFSADRDGFVIGEGAGILLLERESFAKKRGAKIYAELCGYALTSEAFNIMSPKTDGEGMARTMQKAIESAGINKEDVAYINAHGTSTTLNDSYETSAIKKVFEAHAFSLLVNSSKSMLGHTIGAAGAIEAAITVKSLIEQKVHPTINLTNPDPELDLDYVKEGAREINLKYALSNSFAFGGHNSTLVFSKY